MNITLYTVIGKTERIAKAFQEYFGSVIQTIEKDDSGEGLTCFTFCDKTKITYTVNHDAHFMKEHTFGMRNYFDQIPISNNDLKESILQQIMVFNCVAGCEFEINDNEERTDYIIDTMFRVAKEVNGLLLFPDMSLFSSEGRLLISREGKSSYDSYLPIGNSDFIDSGAPETKGDLDRKERSFAVLRERKIPYIEHLGVIRRESDIRIQDIKAIAKRLYAMFAVCVYSEARGSGESRGESLKYVDSVDEILSGRLKECLTNEENKYLLQEDPDERTIAKFSWRYECCNIFLWVLGKMDSLPFPDSICDVSKIAEILWNQHSMDSFLDSCIMRPAFEILDAADLILRMDWACVDARVKGNEAPSGMDAGVVYEQHYAFEWLICAGEGTDWDDVSPNT